ncbi:MAG TPA: ribonuclease III [Lachnospiraceae bacterium]|nr:ribonuclease III [Lachnospiraceae bacterium]HBE08193.1 ribonuclease III [Lachnospiraceae bacterium]
MTNLNELEEAIGYHFHNQELLIQALTHSSYANEKHMKPLSDNERLEFLGDAVLELVSSEFLYQNYPNDNEGKLSKLRASLVCEPTLSYCTEEMDLKKYIRLSFGEEKTGGRNRKSIRSDALEAVIGAMFLDGGLEPAKEFVLRFILTDIEHKKLYHDCKTALQEIVQAEHTAPLTYELIKEEGPDHAKVFTVEAKVGDLVIGQGVGSSKKAAEQEAAYQGILYAQKQKDSVR